jgi:uncharacterized protein YjiS (DUF1127 family)
MIDPRPYTDEAAMLVLSRLDPHDVLEAEAVRGEAVTHLSLFGDWRAMRGAWVAGWVVYTEMQGGEPFALLALANTGQRGVAGASLLARDHRRYRRPMVQLARLIRETLPDFAADLGITRIEARAWARHPRASAFLQLVGFSHECDMPGFGRDGTETFRQFAWTDTSLPALPRETPCED